ncbi:hypothetical protein SY89_01958 [Halolamina pelagica]|uniref:DUF1102 domain-containing protein n=1 Tax=Halolamina pelagica TaxID=699431 RepID=A0A0P7GPZ1_9EURY|nr:hypothetical protein [Halolamina pelagica]KPN31215.1 hypothetical protein SY89_01958 [Halolamina pelagica]
MNYQRAVSVLLAVTAASMLVTGSFGFTSVSADRGVSVAVVDSENAYVGVSVCEKDNGNENGANPVKVTVTNQFSEQFTVDRISWSDSAHPNKSALNPEVTLDSGDSHTFNNAFGDQVVTVEVSDGLEATVNAEVQDRSTCKTNGVGGEAHADGDKQGKEKTETPEPDEEKTETPEPDEEKTETPEPDD